MAVNANHSFLKTLSDAKATVLAVTSSISAADHAVPDAASKVSTACDELGLKAATGTYPQD